MIVKDLGIATAYGYAKEEGYTGTEEEFAILMASYATVAEEAAQSATTAGNAATSASNSAQTATTKASEASASASNAATSASNAASSASSANTSAQTATTKAGEASASATRAEEAADSINEPDTTLTIAGRAADAKAVGDALANLDVDTVNNARQLLSEKYLLDEEPYLFRASGGDGSDRVEECIVGGSVGWNQQFPKTSLNFTSTKFNVSSSNDGVWEVTVNTADACAADGNVMWLVSSVIKSGHKYLFVTDNQTIKVIIKGAGYTTPTVFTSSSFSGSNISVIYSANSAGNYTVRPQLIDLTTLFGSTIADYIYSLEQATAGAGVAFFRKYFPEDYYPYSAPTLRHVEGVSQKQVVGFNQWDEDYALGFWGTNGTFIVNTGGYMSNKTHIPVLPNTAYCFTIKRTNGASFYLAFYDANKNFISRKTCAYVDSDRMFTTPNNCHYVCFSTFVSYGATYNHDICINISDPTKNGVYEPYHKNIYPLDSSLTLRGIPKLTDGKMWFDGDKYNADGTVQRRYGIVDLGTLDWINYKSGGFRAPISPIPKNGTGLVAPNAIASKYFSWQGTSVTLADGMATITTYEIYVVDGNFTTDASAFKTAMSGVYLVYELATPTTETATPYTALQTLDPHGTEEFVSTGIVPVGHESHYLENLRSKIEGLPKDFSTLIAPTEETYKATQNYTVGSLLIVDNILYKVTSAIANGGSITPNTNVTATTLAAVIAAL